MLRRRRREGIQCSEVASDCLPALHSFICGDSEPEQSSKSSSEVHNDGPCISSQETTLKDHHHDAEEEESGWTTYLEDFSRYRSLTSGLEHHSSFTSPSLSLGSSSLVSDAASRYHDLPIPPLNGLGYNQETSMKKLSLIKNNRRPKKIKEREDPLEDTASSPVSIPTR
ncbi:hypothetical protein SAY86_012204 [Trapa natans]|uniref:Uncharacterized protein n=1 Tax=Trapa natans TaxID=22666 RepID=A0AAN7RAF1_TRANT|nr:hypothetical protein SAY86_012204 [Trapa natans]